MHKLTTLTLCALASLASAAAAGKPFVNVPIEGEHLQFRYSAPQNGAVMGHVIHVKADGSQVSLTPGGGVFAGLNGHANIWTDSHLLNEGPLPWGHYAIGPQTDDPKMGPIIHRLTPTANTDLQGRSGGFAMHGGDGRLDASDGCVVTALRDDRLKIEPIRDAFQSRTGSPLLLHVIPLDAPGGGITGPAGTTAAPAPRPVAVAGPTAAAPQAPPLAQARTAATAVQPPAAATTPRPPVILVPTRNLFLEFLVALWGPPSQ